MILEKYFPKIAYGLFSFAVRELIVVDIKVEVTVYTVIGDYTEVLTFTRFAVISGTIFWEKRTRLTS